MKNCHIPEFEDVFNESLIEKFNRYSLIDYEAQDSENERIFLNKCQSVENDEDYIKFIINDIMKPNYMALYHDIIKSYMALEGMPCYRVIMIDENKIKALDSIGIFWSIERSGAGAYNFDHKQATGNEVSCLIEGRIELDKVDWINTLHRRFIAYNSSEEKEKEIRFNAGVELFIDSVTVNRNVIPMNKIKRL